MKSKGGKIFYRCELCRSSNIKKWVEITGKLVPTSENFYICNTCNVEGKWADRVKQNVADYYNGLNGYFNPSRRFKRYKNKRSWP